MVEKNRSEFKGLEFFKREKVMRCPKAKYDIAARKHSASFSKKKK